MAHATQDTSSSALPAHDIGQMPARLHAALQMKQQLADVGLYFAPIRHHSPACSYAVRSQIAVLRPARILIEAPADFDGMLPTLLDPRTKPPIAILSQAQLQITMPTPPAGEAEAEDGDPLPSFVAETRSAFFPFCDYSPEWVALHAGHAQGAQVSFIDLPWQQQAQFDADQALNNPESNDSREHARSLQAERYLAHSQYIAALSQRSHCRNHDELWDHLFELRPVAELADWPAFFADTFVWSSMARLDYEDDVLTQEASLIREAHMVARILASYRTLSTSDLQPSLVIVTGAFHTLALVELLHQAICGDPQSGIQMPQPPHASVTTAWLIRYSFDRLDALNGYASGMPSPAYYQSVWEAMQPQAKPDSRDQVSLRLLSQIAAATRQESFADPVSFASVQSAASQVSRLAALREHRVIARYDLIDAVHSCFIKGSLDEGQQGFYSLMQTILSGHRLGDIPPATTAPPLVEATRRLALKHRLKLDDTLSRRARLDLYRKPAHRARSRFMHLLRFLDVGFARHIVGPDYIAGANLDLLFEEWDYAWSPLVEARLIDLSTEGSSLDEVALKRILQQEAALEAAGRGRSARHAVGLLTSAAVIGMQQHLPWLLTLLEAHLLGDAELASIVGCGLQLLHLWRGREFLGLDQHSLLPQLILQVLPSAIFLLPRLHTLDETQEQEAIGTLLSLREFARLVQGLFADHETDYAQLQQALARLLDDATEQPLAAGLAGAIAALLYIDGVWSETQLNSQLTVQFGVGSEPAQAVRYLAGLMQAAPELIVQTDTLARSLNALLAAWQENTFVAHLPDLRYAFTHLKPRETASFADRIAQWNGLLGVNLTQHHGEISLSELMVGTQLHVALQDSLSSDGLLAWAGL
jgi:hypothetical protein